MGGIRLVQRRVLEGPQHPAGVEKELLPARAAGGMVLPLQAHVAVFAGGRRPAKPAQLGHPWIILPIWVLMSSGMSPAVRILEWDLCDIEPSSRSSFSPFRGPGPKRAATSA